MAIHDKAFWVIVYFLGGVLLASLLRDWKSGLFVTVLVAAFLAVVFLLFNSKTFAFFSIFLLVGFGYYVAFDAQQRNIDIPYNEKSEMAGIIDDAQITPTRQELVVSLHEPHKGRVRIITERYPDYQYGDVVELSGTVREATGGFGQYLQKENIFGTISFPEIRRMESGKGSPVKEMLFRIKHSAENTFNKIFSNERAAFLIGITLGETAGFTREFKEKLNVTGTSHLVALSGYNVTIIAQSVLLIFALWFRRRATFILSIVAITGFVIMTGAEASVVRAAVMAIIVLLADQVGRVYSFRNSIAVAALLMVVHNPKVLLFDVGFQLSFAALLGIVYVKPALHSAFRMESVSGIFSWRENLLTTASAQLAVLPILLSQFGFFSPISLLTNVLVLMVIPITMFLGFLIAFISVISLFLGRVIGWLTDIFLAYELGVIEFFSRIDIGINTEKFGIILSVLFYALLVRFVFIMRSRERKRIHDFSF